MYNVLVYDCLNECNFIYNVNPVPENELYTIVDLILRNIKKSVGENEIHISYVSQKESIVYIYEEIKQKGWVWDSLSLQKKILYKIQVIACIDLKIENEIQKEIDNKIQNEMKKTFEDKECQTLNENVEHETVECQTIIDQWVQSLRFDTRQESDYDSEIEDSFGTLSDNSDDTIILKTNNNFNELWTHEFTHELKDRLNLENYGLYKYKTE